MMRSARFAGALVLGSTALAAGPLAAAPQLFLHDADGTLGTLDVATGKVTTVGSTGVALTDIAADAKGQLYGMSFDNLYRIDKLTAVATLVGSTGIAGGNGLTFGPGGQLYGVGDQTTSLFRIDPTTGQGQALGSTGRFADGDLAFLGDRLLLSSWDYELVDLNPGSGSASVVGALGTTNVFGLAVLGDQLLGFSGTQALQIDPATGQASFLLDFAGQGLGSIQGATVVTPLPAAAGLFGVGVAALAALRRRQRAA